jgi:hypothetical protein
VRATGAQLQQYVFEQKQWTQSLGRPAVIWVGTSTVKRGRAAVSFVVSSVRVVSTCVVSFVGWLMGSPSLLRSWKGAWQGDANNRVVCPATVPKCTPRATDKCSKTGGRPAA